MKLTQDTREDLPQCDGEENHDDPRPRNLGNAKDIPKNSLCICICQQPSHRRYKDYCPGSRHGRHDEVAHQGSFHGKPPIRSVLSSVSQLWIQVDDWELTEVVFFCVLFAFRGLGGIEPAGLTG